MGNAVTPGMLATKGVISRATSMVVRLRCSHGKPLKNTLPWATVGLPTTVKMRSKSAW